MSLLSPTPTFSRKDPLTPAPSDALADGVAGTYAIDSRTETVDWYAWSTRSIPARPKPASSEVPEFVQARQQDKQRVKGLLAAGKRVAEGE